MRNNQSNEDESLGSALREWTVSASLPPRFNEQVWRRIEAAEARLTVWQMILSRLDAVFSRPATAMAYLSALIVLGLALGFVQAEKKSHEFQAQLSSRYVKSIDPYQRTHP